MYLGKQSDKRSQGICRNKCELATQGGVASDRFGSCEMRDECSRGLRQMQRPVQDAVLLQLGEWLE
jgi:hypothetical protein